MGGNVVVVCLLSTAEHLLLKSGRRSSHVAFSSRTINRTRVDLCSTSISPAYDHSPDVVTILQTVWPSFKADPSTTRHFFVATMSTLGPLELYTRGKGMFVVFRNSLFILEISWVLVSWRDFAQLPRYYPVILSLRGWQTSLHLILQCEFQGGSTYTRCRKPRHQR